MRTVLIELILSPEELQDYDGVCDELVADDFLSECKCDYRIVPQEDDVGKRS